MSLTPEFFRTFNPPPPRSAGLPEATARAVRVPVVRSGMWRPDPCAGCPLERSPRIPPAIPDGAAVVCVGMFPSGDEERTGQPFTGPGGQLLRRALREAGLDPSTEVGYANLTRCRAPDDDPESPQWVEAEKRCWQHLSQDLARTPDAQIVLLGTKPVQRFFGGKDEHVGYWRGLLGRTPTGSVVYTARHPAQILRTPQQADRQRLEREFGADLARLRRRVRREGPAPLKFFEILTSPAEARPLLGWITQHPGPWGFDIETHDAAQTPAREGVATDPCHPDFRLRGVAIAWAPDQGAWFEVMGQDPAAWRPLLSGAFGSPAPKAAFGGHFDEEGLVYPGWVERVQNRSQDGMLALIALGDGRQSSYRLERAVVDILGADQYWGGFDKRMVATAPLGQIAEAAVRDAGTCLWLCHELERRMAAGEYMGPL